VHPSVRPSVRARPRQTRTPVWMQRFLRTLAASSLPSRDPSKIHTRSHEVDLELIRFVSLCAAPSALGVGFFRYVHNLRHMIHTRFRLAVGFAMYRYLHEPCAWLRFAVTYTTKLVPCAFASHICKAAWDRPMYRAARSCLFPTLPRDTFAFSE